MCPTEKNCRTRFLKHSTSDIINTLLYRTVCEVTEQGRDRDSAVVPMNFHHRCPLILIQVASPLQCHSELHPPPPPPALALYNDHTQENIIRKKQQVEHKKGYVKH